MAAKLTHSKKLSGLLASFGIIVMLGANLFTTFTIDFSTLVFVFTKVLPISFGLGFLGHLIGSILDRPRRRY